MKSSNSSSLLATAQIQGWSVVVIGFIGFIAWAATYPINQGIPGVGFVISAAEKIQIISPYNGLVTNLAKRAGDIVQEGDLLLELDDKTQQANVRSLYESIRGIEVSNESLRSALSARKAQLAGLQAQYDSSSKLVNSGFASPNALAVIQTQLSLAQSEALELKSRIELNDYRLRELRENLAALHHEIEHFKIYTPTSGTVMNVMVKSDGVTITAGSQIMEIVPGGIRLSIDARFPVEYATIAHSGMDVDVMFPTIPGSSYVRIKGVLEYLSPDRLTDVRTNQIYLEGRVILPDQSQIEALKLRPGLPVTMSLKAGSRTLMSYITRPLSERINKGMQ